MAVNRVHRLYSDIGETRFHPVPKRVRVESNGFVVAQTEAPVLVWEPRRIVPQYAVPAGDFQVELAESAPVEATEHPVTEAGRLVLSPTTSFGFHTAPGTSLSVGELNGAGFRLSDPDLSSLVILDFESFDWFEEDEPIFGHPRDPLSRIDLRRSSRHVRIELDGVVLAESAEPLMLFETSIPARYYLDRKAVAADLVPGTLQTVCAYKGHATHWSVAGDRGANIAWSYETPPPEMHQITSLVSFYQERTDFFVDDQRLTRPKTPWS